MLNDKEITVLSVIKKNPGIKRSDLVVICEEVSAPTVYRHIKNFEQIGLVVVVVQGEPFEPLMHFITLSPKGEKVVRLARELQVALSK